MPKLFATTGIRGKADKFFTKEFCNRIGFVFGEWLRLKQKEGWVAVATDSRQTSPRIAEHVSQGLAAAGFEIEDHGVIPTPALTLLTKETGKFAGGVMVTGSHVTSDLNGLKFLVEGEEISKIQETEIEELFSKIAHIPQITTPITVVSKMGAENYLEALVKLANGPYSKLKLVVDTGNGAQSETIKELLKRLKVKAEYANGSNMQYPSFFPKDSDVPAQFADISRLVLQKKADLGVIFDTDGDRAVFIDETGRFVTGDYSCAILAKEAPGSSLVTPITSSSVVEHVGKKVYRTPVGSTRVIAKMKETGSQVGFESNGGIIWASHLYGRDGGATLVLMLNLLKTSQKSLADLYDSLPVYFVYRDKTNFPKSQTDQVFQEVSRTYADLNIDSTDGLKVIISQDEWVLFRPSGTAEEFRVYAQAKTYDKAVKIGHTGMDLVTSAMHPMKSSLTEFTDSLNIGEAIKFFPHQCRQVISEMPLTSIPNSYHTATSVVVSGMGGSALGGRIVSSLQRQIAKVPILVSHEYHLPQFVDEKTLVVATSYSGDTEETISSLQDALVRRAMIFVICSGGQLAQLAKDNSLPCYVFSDHLNASGSPRMGLGYNSLSLLILLARLQLTSPLNNLSQLPGFLSETQDATWKKSAEIASLLEGKIPLILSAEHLKGVGVDLRNQLNETGKHLAADFDLPEANHHLLEGLPHPHPELWQVVLLSSKFYDPKIKRRVEVTKTVLTKQKISFVEISVEGSSILFEVFWAMQLSAMVSFELGKLNAIDPGPVPWVDFFKDQLKGD